MALAQREQDLAIERANGASVAVGQVDAAVGHAQVVKNSLELLTRDDLADRNLHGVGQPCCLLDAGASRGAQVQADLTGVDIREKVTTQHRVEQTGDQTEAHEQQGKAAPVRQQRRQRQRIGPAHALEAAVKGAVQARQQTVPGGDPLLF